MKYYEVFFHDDKEKSRFLMAVRHEMKLRNWEMQDLANSIGRSRNALYDFFNCKNKSSRFIAADIANLFQFQRKEWSNDSED